ncbi:histamine H3 receptor-like [Argopecten irradians]|uniref:histamine H3 receptor-like n=1 Tax=Argopecten irradians TaxID=31199 RepID=UPI0037145EE6
MNEIHMDFWKMNEDEVSSTMKSNEEIYYARSDASNGIPINENFSRHLITDDSEPGLVVETEDDQLSLWLAAVPLIAMVVVNVLANGAIILIFIKKRCIRRCRNIYILSIAVADFLIGLSMPLSIVETLSRKWIFWPFSCWVFLMVRYSLFFISFISIILLTLDRWWSINFPFSYRVRQSRTMATIIVVCSWFVSFILHIPLIIGWESFDDSNAIITETYCRVPQKRNFIFTICAFVLEYLIPLTCLIFLNFGIYFKLSRRRNTKKIRRSMSSSDTYMLYSRKTSSDSGGSNSFNNNNNNFDDAASDVTLYTHIPDVRRHSVYLYTSRRSSSSLYKVPKNSLGNFNRAHQNSRRVSVDTASLVKSNRNNHCIVQQKPSFPSRKQSDDIVKDFLGRQDKKAILSLGLLTLVASVCWTPYTLSSVVSAFCPTCIPSWLSVFFYWILAANSTINPFLYGIGNPDFRKVLRTWMACFTQHGINMDNETLLYCQLQQNCELETLREYNVLQLKNSSL